MGLELMLDRYPAITSQTHHAALNKSLGKRNSNLLVFNLLWSFNSMLYITCPLFY